ncbi:glycine cleavage system protein T [Euryarchaeota archaeon ex4484_178]|nr:MAG: glycine cleavage system protein T [Euryarchaeota archaeon ex4484_178]
MKSTALHDIHIELGAKMTEFAGFHMPLWYKGIIEEHRAVRESVGVFDVSHMGDLLIVGAEATDFLSYILPTDFHKVPPMKATYTAFINHRGILIDDTIVTKINDERYLIVPNAATTELIYNWIYSLGGGYNIKVKNLSSEYSCLAIQGRNAEKLLQRLVKDDLSKLGFFNAILAEAKGLKIEDNEISGNKLFISRTGYTGEDGFEVIVPNNNAKHLWELIMRVGKDFGIEPCGLGARDTLRMEKGFLLSGQDFHPYHEPRTPLEAGISWIVDWEHEFIGKDILIEMKKEKKYELFRGILMKERGVPRSGYKIYHEDEEVGYLTSGTLSPTLNIGIGLGYIKRPYIKVGTEVYVDIRGRKVKGEIRKPRLVK